MKKLNLFISCLLIASFLLSCKENNNTYLSSLEKIDLDKGLNNKKEVSLSQIASDIEYIPLETKENCLITDVTQVILFRNKVIVFDERQRNVFLFGSDGKFIRKIGKKGNGPGEYSDAYRLVFNDRDSTILIKDRDNLLYDLDGNFLYRNPVFPEMGQIAFLGDNVVFSFARPDFVFNNNFQIAVCDKEYKPLNRFIKRNNENITLSNMGQIEGNMMNHLQYFSDTLSYWEYKYDTIYRIPDKNHCFPRYALTYSRKQTLDARYEESKSRVVEKLIETGNYIFLQLFDPSGNSAESIDNEMIYFKRSKEIVTLKFSGNARGLINDIDGGLALLPRKLLKDGRVYTSFSPFNLKKQVEENPYNEVKPLNIAKQRELHKILDNSKLEDNPVIMIVRLK